MFFHFLLSTNICLAISLLCGFSEPVLQEGPLLQHHLFDTDKPLEITLTGNIKELMNDRGENPVYHPFSLSWYSEDPLVNSIEIAVKARGNYRKEKKNCKYPPLMLNFENTENQHPLFNGQTKLKLVTPCIGDKYVIREYLSYKLFQVISDYSFRVRLVKLVFKDQDSQEYSESMLGFLLENDDILARRHQSTVIKKDMIKPQSIDPNNYFQFAIFEYLIGNTDWSVQYRHNVKLLYHDTEKVLRIVPYDFDHAGIVNTPYAKPAAALKLKSVRHRRFRGYCIPDLTRFDAILAKFIQLKPKVYEVYNHPLLREKSYKENTLKFLDVFYDTINDDQSLLKMLNYPCTHTETSRMIIKGMRK